MPSPLHSRTSRTIASHQHSAKFGSKWANAICLNTFAHNAENNRNQIWQISHTECTCISAKANINITVCTTVLKQYHTDNSFVAQYCRFNACFWILHQNLTLFITFLKMFGHTYVDFHHSRPRQILLIKFTWNKHMYIFNNKTQHNFRRTSVTSHITLIVQQIP